MLLICLLPASPSLTCPDLPKQGAILPAPWGHIFFLLGTNMTRLPRHHRTLETNPVLFSLINDNTPSPPAAYPTSPPSSPFPAKVSLVLSVALHQRKNGRLESRAGRALPCAQGAIHVLPGEASVQREACACGQLPNPASSLLIRAWNQREHRKVAVKSVDDKDVLSVFQNTRLIKKAPSPTEKVSDRRN